MRTRFAPLIARVTELVYGPEPVGAAGAAVLQRYATGELNASRFGGAPHYGMKGDPELTFAGYVADPQVFQGAAQLGASHNASVQDYPALPSDQGPSALPTWLEDWGELEGLVP